VLERHVKPLVPVASYYFNNTTKLSLSSTHWPLQLVAISLDLRLLVSSSCQPSCAYRHSTWPVLRLPRPELHSRYRLPQQLSVLWLIWPPATSEGKYQINMTGYQNENNMYSQQYVRLYNTVKLLQ
jgi:hypothetical protein